MGDTDQRAQQVERVEIFADVPVFDSALHERLNRSLNQATRTLIESVLLNDVQSLLRIGIL